MEYELVYGLPKAEVLAQMAEELTEAAQAALKLRRAMDGANPTPISVDTGMKNLIEELADCQLCEDIFFHGMATQCVSHAYKEIDRIKSEKMERWETRLAGLYGQDGLDVELCEKPLHCGYVPRSVQVR